MGSSRIGFYVNELRDPFAELNKITENGRVARFPFRKIANSISFPR